MYRLFSLVLKELQILFGNAQSRRILIIPLLLQITLFPFAATLEVKNNTLAIFNEDQGADSYELIQRFANTKAFTTTLYLTNENQLREVITNQAALLAIRFPQDFSRKIRILIPPSLEIILDGRRSNASQIALRYIQEITDNYLYELNQNNHLPPLSDIIVRHRFNPNLDYTYFILPSLIAIFTTLSALIVTALSIAREREQGTFDQLCVSPLTPEMIMLGKAIPALIVSLAQATVVLIVAVFIYRIPFQGSLFIFYGSMIFYIIAVVGIGLFISSFCTTQQQAFLGTFSFLMPAILLSGYVAPIENMPSWLQTATWINPLRHFLVIIKSIFLKDASLAFVFHKTLPLVLIAVLTGGMAILFFRKKVQ